MSLIGALSVGQTALAAQQAALQVTGNNISNASNPDYVRQTVEMQPGADQQMAPGVFLGTGVDLTAVQRQVSDALDSRLRSSTSDSNAASTTQQWLSQVESTFNALGTTDLSSQLSTFFTSWSTLANSPQDAAQRQVVVQNGDSIARQFNSLRSQLTGLVKDSNTQLQAQVNAADGLAQQVAALNGQIVVAEGGTGGTANSLRDQRDAALGKLSALINIKTVPQNDGSVNVYVGSQPLVFGAQSSGAGLSQQVVNGQNVSTITFKTTGGTLPASSGQLAALQSVQTQVSGVVSQLDSLAHNLIFELNKLHASGQGLQGLSSVTSTNAVTDPAAALNSPSSGLTFAPSNGSFVVHVRQKDTGQVTSSLVQVNLSGQGTQTSLNSLAASLSGINGVAASVTGGKLQISAANSAVDISFSQDSSSALAALGINTFYTGTDASDIAVNNTVAGDPAMLAAAKNGDQGDNQTAVAIASLESQPVAGLSGASLKDTYQSMINGIAVQTAGAKTNATATQAVVDTLTAQRSALSGVSLDEEAINLMQQQRAFQGAARLITAVDQMMQTVLNILP